MGVRYIYRTSSEFDLSFDDFESFPLQIEQLTEKQIRVFTPLTFLVVAGDQELALARFRSTVAWMSAIREYSDPILNIELEQLESSATTQGIESLELSPIEQVVNYPNAWLWQESNKESSLPEKATSQYLIFMQSELHLIRTDTLHEAVTALESLNSMLPQVLSDPVQWKWVIQTLHAVLQNFMVAALEGTSPTRVLKPLSKKEQERISKGKMVERKLKNFMDLYACIKDGDMMSQYTVSHVFVPNATQDKNVEDLNELRNEFIHFTPKSYVLDVWNFPSLTQDIIDIIRFLAFQSANVHWYHDGFLRLRTKSALTSIASVLDHITENYRLDVSSINTSKMEPG